MDPALHLLIELVVAIATVVGIWLVHKDSNKQAAEKEQEIAKLAAEKAHEKDLEDVKWKTAMSGKVDTLWKFVFRKTVLEGLESGLLDRNSPIRSNLEALNTHPELIEKIRHFYEEKGKDLDDLTLLVEIENQFNAELIEFEIHHKFKAGASLAAVCYMLRPSMGLFAQFDRRAFVRRDESRTDYAGPERRRK